MEQTVLDAETRIAPVASTGPAVGVTALATQGSRDLAAVPATGPMAMALQALASGMTIADMRGLLDLQKDHEANEARKAFAADMAAFKLNPPTILKDKHVYFETEKGVTEYDHATIGNVCDKIIVAAAAYGFTHRWVPGRTDDGKQSVTTVVTHRLGHAEKTTLVADKDASGGKNQIQAMISANSYMQRHGVLMAFGFATIDQPDDDGRGAGDPLEGFSKPAPGADMDDSATPLALEWIAKAKACKTTVELREVRKDACAAFEAAADLARWNYFKLWLNTRIAAMSKATA